MRFLLAASAAAFCLAAATVPNAYANDTGNGSFIGTVGASGSYQSTEWDKGSRKIRIEVRAGNNMNTSRCIDGAVDWKTKSGHYDVRVVRVCRPGGTESTDPGGDGWWLEPSDWDGRTVVGMRVAGGILIGDTYPFANHNESLSQLSVGRPYQSTNHVAPRSGSNVDFWARIRTMYQDGQRGTASINKTPERCFGKGDLPWNCN